MIERFEDWEFNDWDGDWPLSAEGVFGHAHEEGQRIDVDREGENLCITHMITQYSCCSSYTDEVGVTLPVNIVVKFLEKLGYEVKKR